MNWIIDISLIVITLATILLYTFKGFIKSALGSCKGVLAFLIAYLSASALGAWISNTFMLTPINNAVYNWLSGILSQAETQVNINDIVNQLPRAAVTFFKSIGVSAESILSQHGHSVLTTENLSAVADSVASPISSFISTAIAFVSVFVLSIVIFTILIFLLDKIFQMPGLKQLNRTLGLIFGTICAFINLVVICSVLTLILNIAGINNPNISAEAIKETTVVYRLISNINVFSWFL